MINFSFFWGVSPHFLGVHVAGCDLTWAQCCVGEDLTTPVPAPVGNLMLQVMMNQLLILFFNKIVKKNNKEGDSWEVHASS